MEPRRIWNCDVERIPRVPLDEKSGHVGHLRHEKQAAPPMVIFKATEVPADATENQEMIPAVGFLKRVLTGKPFNEMGTMEISHLGGVVAKEVLPGGDAAVKWNIKGGGRGGIISSTSVVEHPTVENEFEGELVGGEPGREEISGYGAREVAGRRAESGVGDGGAAGSPVTQSFAAGEEIFVQGRGEIVDEDKSLRASFQGGFGGEIAVEGDCEIGGREGRRGGERAREEEEEEL